MSNKESKLALVTGGTNGIGFGVAKKLAESGHDLILGYNSNHERAESAKKKLISTFGVRVFTVPGDVAEEGTINVLFDVVKREFKDRLHVFVHNAGLVVGLTTSVNSQAAQKAVEDPGFSLVCDGKSTFSEYDYYQSVYPKCFVRCVERALPLMTDGEGYIVAISSPGCNAAVRPVVEYAPGPGKAVMEHLVRCYAVQLAPRRITCNCVVPGLTRTDAAIQVFGKGDPKKMEDAVVAFCPMKVMLNPEDVGETVAFLCSSKASFITGACLNVDGGLSLIK